MELVVSSDFVHLWKRIIGRDLGDGFVGFFGAASSILIIYEGYLKASSAS